MTGNNVQDNIWRVSWDLGDKTRYRDFKHIMYVENFEKDTLKCESLTESGCFVRDLFINGHDCRICFIISMVEEDEENVVIKTV